MSEGADTFACSNAGVTFHPVRGGGLLFNSADSRLYALNPAAGLTWLCVRDGLSRAETTLAITNAFAVDLAVADEWLDTSLAMFRSFGLFDSVRRTEIRSGPTTRATPQTSRSEGLPSGPRAYYRLFEQLILITAPIELQPAIDGLLGALRLDRSSAHPAPEPIGLQIEISPSTEGWNIGVDGHIEVTCETASVVAEIERLVVQAVVPATPHLLTLHAAAVQRNDRTLVLAGPSGTGKTTLSVALARAGWHFGSDDIVLLGRDLICAPYRFLPASRPTISRASKPGFRG